MDEITRKNEEQEKLINQAIKNRRSSILKLSRNRNPLGELEGVESCDDFTRDLTLTNKPVRRVSFASSNFIKPFVTDPDKNTIWDTTYEEEVNHTDSTQSSQEQSKNSSSKMNTSFFNSAASESSKESQISSNNNSTNMSVKDMETTTACGNSLPTEKENIPLFPERVSIVDYAKKLSSSSNAPSNIVWSNEKMSYINRKARCSNVTVTETETMEFTCHNAELSKCEEVEDEITVDSSNLRETETVDKSLITFRDEKISENTNETILSEEMEFTCQIPLNDKTMKTSNASNSNKLSLIDSVGKTGSAMELTCGVPQTEELSKMDDNVKIDSQLCASKIEKMSWVDATITPQIANDKVIEETSVMEFTCHIPTILIKKQKSTLSNEELTDDNSHLSKPCTTSIIKKIRDDRTSISKIRNDDTIVTPSDMEFTCQMPIASKLSTTCTSEMKKMSWMNITDTSRVVKDNVNTETLPMEFTCQIPPILKKQNSTLSNVELTDDNSHLSKPCTTSIIKKVRDDRTSISKIRNDDTIVTPSDMEFTCQMPIASKLSTTGTSEIEKMSWADITFRSQVVNDNDYCELSTTSGTSKVEKMSWADITNVSKVGTDNTVTTSPFGKFTYQTPVSKKEKSVVNDMKFNCESSKTGFKSENTENNKAGVCNISADCKQSRLEKISWGNVTTNQVLESENITKATSDVRFTDQIIQNNELTKKLTVRKKCSCEIPTLDNKTNDTVANKILNCQGVKLSKTKIIPVPNWVEPSYRKPKANLFGTCSDFPKIPVLDRKNIKTPEPSFHLNLSVSPGMDDTQQLIHCTYTKPNPESFMTMTSRTDKDESLILNLENTGNISKPQMESNLNLDESEKDDVRCVSKYLSDVSFLDLPKNKLSTVNDTYVLKRRNLLSETNLEEMEVNDDKNENKTDGTNKDQDLNQNNSNDSSLGLLPSVDLELEEYPEVQLPIKSDHQPMKKMELKDISFTMKKYNPPKDLLEKLKKNDAEIRKKIDNVKFKPLLATKKFKIIEESSSEEAGSLNGSSAKILNETEPSIEEKIQKHHESSQKLWKLEKIEGDVYHFSTLYGTLDFAVELNSNCGQVINIKTKNCLSADAKPTALYTVKLFLDSLSKDHLTAAIGEHYDVLSLLDYVKLTMLKLMAFQKVLHHISFELSRDFVAKFRVISKPAVISGEILVDIKDLENINIDDIKFRTRIGKINEDEFKKFAKTCPKGLDFIKCFINCIDDYLTVQEKRKRLERS